MGTPCKRCGADIEFVRMKSGKFNPVNAKPVFIIITDDGRVEAGRESHFSNCPGAKEFRHGKERATPSYQ